MEPGEVKGPVHIQCETTNVCNAHCVFCVHDRFQSFETMDDALYEKIVLDAAQYEPATFSPMMTGEPYCDKRMSERLRLARKLMPETVLVLFTNGSIITKDDIDVLVEVQPIKFTVSLNGASRETRKKLMGLDDWDIVAEKINYMYEVGIEPILTMAWFPTVTVEEINAFAQLHNFRQVRFQNWAGQFYPYTRGPTSCGRVTEYMTILRTGDVVQCCFDAFGTVRFGNLREQTIGEVWDSELKQQYIAAHLENRGETIPLCGNCTEGA